MSNIFEKLKIPEGMRLTKQRTGYNEAFEAIQAEYDKLCPKPSQFGIAINAFLQPNGYIRFNNFESNGDYSAISNQAVEIPLGLDWRLCRWSIEDAKRIHGDNQ